MTIPECNQLKILRSYYDKNLVIPPYSKIAELLGYRSKSAAWNAINNLVFCGYFEITPEKRIKPTHLFIKFDESIFTDKENKK